MLFFLPTNSPVIEEYVAIKKSRTLPVACVIVCEFIEVVPVQKLVLFQGALVKKKIWQPLL